MKRNLITTQKWRNGSKTTKKLPIRIYSESKLYEMVTKYQTPTGAIFYQSQTDGKNFSVDFNPRTGEFNKTSIQENRSHKYIDFIFTLRSNLSLPDEFKKATKLNENSIAYGENKFSFSLIAAMGRDQLPSLVPNGNDKKLEQILNKLNSIGDSTPPQQPAMDMDELSAELADKMVSDISSKLSKPLADEIMERLTRSDDFMNKLAETVGFKLATTMSTRLNRLEANLESKDKESSNKMTKEITKNVFSMFKEAGWLK